MLLSQIINRLFLSRNQRQLIKYTKIAKSITEYGERLSAATDDDLRDKISYLRERSANGEELDKLLIECFAIVREASERTLGLRHFDVQLIGGIALHNSQIIEMKTGEGKTLCATLPAVLNALSGKGVHVVTVNDYLAKRDAQWMGKLYTFLGLSVSALTSELSDIERKKVYQADIVYAVNNELGFDYLRDNMKFNAEGLSQRSLEYAIIDEVDSILIDEARTPLIISGQTNEPSELYITVDSIVSQFVSQKDEQSPGDYYLDEKSKKVYLSETGHNKAEDIFHDKGLIPRDENLYYQQHLHLLHHLEVALQANNLYHKDKDYVVNNRQVMLVDEFTGRLMTGRRLSHGLHQAIEAKEGVPILPNSQTLASITFQNFFRSYKKISGMTGTADTEAQELLEIYNLEVLILPTNKKMVRSDFPDLVYLDKKSKYDAILDEVVELQKRGKPVLIGTTSIDVSEELSKKFKSKNIKHEVLNAKNHENEARIIAQAGKLGVVTIATNMAGRGTDIILGGNPDYMEPNPERDKQWKEQHDKVIELGGLHIIGSERHESRRVDNQLRGRSGRQGDPGSSRFYLSLEDSLLKIFASDNINKMMQWIGFEPGQSIEHKYLTRTIESAQKKVEAHNFQLRKNLLEYDTVANDQREIIYQQRNEILNSTSVESMVSDMAKSIVTNLIAIHAPEDKSILEWNTTAIEDQLKTYYFIDIDINQLIEAHPETSLLDHIVKIFDDEILNKKTIFGNEHFQQLIKQIMLAILDKNYKDHLINLEELLRGIHLRGYAAKNPKQEYKREAFGYFVKLLDTTKSEIVAAIMQPVIKDPKTDTVNEETLEFNHTPPSSAIADSTTNTNEAQAPVEKTGTIVNQDKVKRNDPCPCGSGLKYKKCHGKN